MGLAVNGNPRLEQLDQGVAARGTEDADGVLPPTDPSIALTDEDLKRAAIPELATGLTTSMLAWSGRHEGGSSWLGGLAATSEGTAFSCPRQGRPHTLRTKRPSFDLALWALDSL